MTLLPIANSSQKAFFQVDGGLHQNPDGTYEGGGGANVTHFKSHINLVSILIIHHRNNWIYPLLQVILYVGLGMISVGLVITFVGLGEKGFKTLELKLIGPSLVGCGVFFALLRVLFCTLPSCCRSLILSQVSLHNFLFSGAV